MDKEQVLQKIELLRETALKNYVPVMRTATAKLLQEMVEEYRPKRILEVGTCIGTSGMIALASCEESHLTTIEIDEERQREAKKHFSECGFCDRVTFLLGDCHEIVYFMDNNKYDFCILDGPKTHYLELYEWILPMINQGGVIFVDDISFHSLVEKETVEHKHRATVNGIKAFLKRIAEDKRVKVTTYKIEDGVVIIKKR